MSELIIRRREADPNSKVFSQVHPLLARIYASRGLDNAEALGRSLQQLQTGRDMLGLAQAVKRLVMALQQDQHILIIGDFDCDGATSTAVAVLGLGMMGANRVSYLVPNRFEFGYGLSPEIVNVAAQQQPDLIITVDNGISSVSGVAEANALGIDVLITDHHLPGDQLPDACAIVNPNQPGCNFSEKSTCGVGVIFYVMTALRRALEEQNWFEVRGLAKPNLGSLLDLVALGTVADVVPLEQNNRTLVYQGLQRIRSGKARPGIMALIEISGRQRSRLTATDLGFALAPRLNAAGRLDDMSIGIECLLTNDPECAQKLALQLDTLNQERRGIEQEMQQQAVALLDELQLDAEGELPFGLCLYDPDWHQGVIGILASRIKDKLNRPVVAFAIGDEGELKGSARSVTGFHIRDGLDVVAAKHPELLKKFGGHAMAAGMTIAADNLGLFQQAFDAEVRRQLTAEQLQHAVLTDGTLTGAELSMEIAELLRESGPWGHQFPEPLFDGEFSLLQQRIVGQRHLKLVLMEPQSGIAIDAIHFNADTDIWPNDAIQRVRAVYRLDINEFRGQRSLQLMIDHLLPL
ncbi:single-stranded-DNA-specific exonuclease RecJ [Amphritea pacifica]|uniref:Single-stranded-DNA-specific exonuclease RecJ n=1 Tax=Amphritea pacifica TaxID=2811233 RepID=A0ABS2W4P3_9GAMM|nr:single-stranded-DNA-specific exonuclease RecJ [Amphritea pacifica]MBN0986377.1 single-stranded-DNA-specific exonuclease RecJ [Amphritea pacifica]MBN1007070.1 single-stranded-DNA-specific exonuclease RecJ [Amphritea pacifica]